MDNRTDFNRKSADALEGTSSMIHDRVNKIIYMSISERSCLSTAKDYSKALGYRLVSFHSVKHY